MEFCKAFNAQTAELGDTVIPVIVTVYEDRSFSFIIKTPPTTNLIKKELNITKGSSTPGKETVWQVNKGSIKKIAAVKLPVFKY